MTNNTQSKNLLSRINELSHQKRMEEVASSRLEDWPETPDWFIEDSALGYQAQEHNPFGRGTEPERLSFIGELLKAWVDPVHNVDAERFFGKVYLRHGRKPLIATVGESDRSDKIQLRFWYGAPAAFKLWPSDFSKRTHADSGGKDLLFQLVGSCSQVHNYLQQLPGKLVQIDLPKIGQIVGPIERLEPREISVENDHHVTIQLPGCRKTTIYCPAFGFKGLGAGEYIATNAKHAKNLK